MVAVGFSWQSLDIALGLFNAFVAADTLHLYLQRRKADAISRRTEGLLRQLDLAARDRNVKRFLSIHEQVEASIEELKKHERNP